MTRSSADPDIDLSEKDLNKVLRILRAHVLGFPVWVFGSRVTGEAGTYSDLDLTVITKDPLPLSTVADLKEAFDESDLVFKVDVVDWATTSETFRRIIEKGKVVLQSGETRTG